MTFYIEFDEGVENDFPFEAGQLVEQLAKAVLEAEGCACEVCINMLVTDNERIREYNRDYRKIDKATDVLSFPNLDFDAPGNFEIEKDREADYYDPDTGELVLGDIILSAEKVREQAEEYGNSLRREFAFLVTHSLLHLCGYDHMEETEAGVMEAKQEAILSGLGITRD